MKKFNILIGLLISSFFLYLALKGINWKNVGETIEHANYIFLIPAILIHFISFYVRSFKWSLITSKFKKVTTLELFPLITIGLAMNNILPLRAGEIGRIFLLSNKYHISKIHAGITLITERFFDIIGLLIVILVLVNLHPFSASIHDLVFSSTIIILLFIALSPFVVFLIDKSIHHHILDKFRKGMTGKILEKLLDLRGLYKIYKDPKLIGILVLFSVILWLIEGLSYYTLSFAFGIHISLIDFILICGLVNISSAIPSTSGFIGTFEFFTTTLLVFLGIAKSLALSYVLLLHIEVLLPVTIVGIYFYFTHNYSKYMSLKQIEEIES